MWPTTSKEGSELVSLQLSRLIGGRLEAAVLAPSSPDCGQQYIGIQIVTTVATLNYTMGTSNAYFRAIFPCFLSAY